jgi:hypothetical protein
MTDYRITPVAHWDSKWAWWAFRSHDWGGTTAMQTGKRLAGSATPAGTVLKHTSIIVSGAVSSAGALIAAIPGAAGGIIQALFRGVRRALPKGFYKE